MDKKIVSLANEIKNELITIRRYLHSNPELSLKEFKSSEYIYNKLLEFGITEIERDFYKTAVLATIRGGQPGKTILLRADMDALPINELSLCNYKSIHEGVMHACGHDAHVTWMLGVACVLNKMKSNIRGNIKIIFQPAEENVGGADFLLAKRDILNESPKVDYAIAGHVWPAIKSGEYGFVNGSAMAAANKFTLAIHGIGGHGAEPHKTIDPISLGNQVYMCAQQIISRQVSPFSNAVFTIGSFIGKGAFNVIPDYITMEGTVRAENYEKVQEIMRSFENITKGIVENQGGKYSLYIDKPIHEVVNDKYLVKFATNVLKEINEEDKIKVLDYGSMTGEDFCYFSSKVPSLFIYVGTKNEEKGITAPLHNPYFNLDEDILLKTVINFTFLTIKLLDNK